MTSIGGIQSSRGNGNQQKPVEDVKTPKKKKRKKSSKGSKRESLPCLQQPGGGELLKTGKISREGGGENHNNLSGNDRALGEIIVERGQQNTVRQKPRGG